VVITGRDSPALRARLAALSITHVYYGTEQKLAAAEETLKKLGATWKQAAAMGDDWPDLPVMTRAAFACAPSNAHAEVKAIAQHVTHNSGGHGAAREFCDLLLVASGKLRELAGGLRHVIGGFIQQVPSGRMLRASWERMSVYLPVILMGFIALGTYWLARNTPALETPQVPGKPTHEPDSYMRGFAVRGFDASGRLKSEVHGVEARHYPDTDTVEIDKRACG